MNTTSGSNFLRIIVAFALSLLLLGTQGCHTTDPLVVKGASVAYYYTGKGVLIYVEDMADVPRRTLHKLRNNEKDTPFMNLMNQCEKLPDPEKDVGLDVMHGQNGIPATAVYISQTQVLAYEELAGLQSRTITALKVLENGGCTPGCFCPPCPSPPTGYNCCCPMKCRTP